MGEYRHMGKIDQRNRFNEDIFSYRAGKDGKVFISWQGKQVTFLRGKQAQKFLKNAAPYFPPEDPVLCLQRDVYDFVLRAEQDGEMVKVRPIHI